MDLYQLHHVLNICVNGLLHVCMYVKPQFYFNLCEIFLNRLTLTFNVSVAIISLIDLFY